MIMDWKIQHIKMMSICSYMINRFNPIPMKISASFFFKDISKTILKLIQKGKRIRIAKVILIKNEVGGIHLPDFKSYYIVMVIKNIWYFQRDKQIDQWNKPKTSEVDLCKYA